MIKTLLTAGLLSLALIGSQAFAATATAAAAAAAASTANTINIVNACEVKAVDRNGKALAGAAKTSYMKKCEGDAASGVACAAKSVDKNGKALAGAAKTSFMKKCEADAAAAK